MKVEKIKTLVQKYTTSATTMTCVNSSLLFPRYGRPSRHFAGILLRIDADPHPIPLPSDGRGNSYSPPSANGGLSGQRSRGLFSETADDSPSPLSAVSHAKADGGEGLPPACRETGEGAREAAGEGPGGRAIASRPPFRCPSPRQLRLAASSQLRFLPAKSSRADPGLSCLIVPNRVIFMFPVL
jgi:hypothetical protein